MYGRMHMWLCLQRHDLIEWHDSKQGKQDLLYFASMSFLLMIHVHLVRVWPFLTPTSGFQRHSCAEGISQGDWRPLLDFIKG